MNSNPSRPGAEDILPPLTPPFRGTIGESIGESKPDWPQSPKPGREAPNILIFLLDDLGFGQSSAFGGPIYMPNVDRLAREGLRYNNYHTASLCSPTRAALLTGRNHHSVGFASIAEMSTGFPGSNAYLPKSAASLPEVLRHKGYFTAAVGKWHLAPAAHVSSIGPFDRWPLGMGFDRFYGFMPGETDHWHPMLTCDNHRIPTPEVEGYHLSEDLAQQAKLLLRNHAQAASGRPIFMYMAFGAPHCPFHVEQSYIDKYKGQFDQGWDAVRQETFERQRQQGIIPPNSVLPARNSGVQPWDSLSCDEKRLFARLQETFAGFVEHTDEQIGKVLEELDRLGIADNTLVMFMSDNGASQEGGKLGTTNTERFRNGLPMSVDEMLKDFDKIGGPDTDPHYPMGWGMAGNAPFKRWKRDSHRGGNTDPLVVRWPSKVHDGGAIRSQYVHVTDVYATVLDLLGIPAPSVVNGTPQMPLAGISFAPTLANASASRAKTVQYYEMLGNRAIWHEGWTAVTWHQPGTDWKNDRWELYYQDEDYTQNFDLAAQHPDKVKEMVALWFEEARKHNVFPLDDRGRERGLDPNRPYGCEARDSYTYYPDTVPVPFNAVPKLLNRPHSITAHLHIPAGGAQGVIITEGSSLGGWAMFVKEGHAYYVHNCLRMSMHVLRSSQPLVEGDCELRFAFEPTATARGIGRLWVNGVESAAPIEIATAPLMYSFVAEGFQIGASWGTPAAYEHYHGRYQFDGTIERVVVALT